jgi:hypothetical protein
MDKHDKHDKHDKRGRRYSAEEKNAPVRMLRTLRAELGTNQGAAQRVAPQFGLWGRVCAVLGDTSRH